MKSDPIPHATLSDRMAITERMMLAEMRQRGLDPAEASIPTVSCQSSLADLVRANIALRVVRFIEDDVLAHQSVLIKDNGVDAAWAMMAEALEGESE